MSRIEDLERRLAKDPNSKIFAQLAEEYRKAGRLEDAINTCREGLQSHPNYFSARVALGRALLESNALEEASQEFEAVLAQVPDNILANKFLGRTYHELERHPDALAKYQIAHSLAPEDSELSSLISEVEAQIRQGLVSQPGPAPLAEYDDPTAFEFEGGENEPTFVEAEPYRPPVPPQPSFLAPQTGSQEAVFEFESSELPGAGIQEPPPVPPAPPSPTAASVPTVPSEVVYELEDREPVPPAPPPVPLVPPVPSPPEAPGEVIYTLDGSEAIEPDASPAGPPSSRGEVVYEFDDQIPVTGEPPSAPIPSGEPTAEEQIFEIEGNEAPPPEERELSSMARRQAEEIRPPTVSDEARAIQDGFEQSFPTGVVQRQVREIRDSARLPKPPTLEPALEIPAEPVPPSDAESVFELEGEEVRRSVTESEQITAETPQPSEPVSGPPVPKPLQSSPEPVAVVEDSAASAGVTTATLAELYASQGHLEQALQVYRELGAKDPDDVKIRQRFEELQMLIQAKAEVIREPAGPAEAVSTAGDRGIRETLRVLEEWLAAIKRP